MSDPVTDVEIEDVLSSIRRLVGDEHRAKPQMAPEPETVDEPTKPARLVLTASLLVPVSDAEPESEAEPESTQSPEMQDLPDEAALMPEAEFVEDEDEFEVEVEPESEAVSEADLDFVFESSQSHARTANEDMSQQAAWADPKSTLFDAAATDDSTDKMHVADDQQPDSQALEPHDLTSLIAETQQATPSQDALEPVGSDQPIADDSDAEPFDVHAGQSDQSDPDDPFASDSDEAEEIEPNNEVDDNTPYSTATLGAKIAALEAKIGQTQDQWEPDGELGDDYAGTKVETIKWQDHDADDISKVPATSPQPIEPDPTPAISDVEADQMESAAEAAVQAISEPLIPDHQSDDDPIDLMANDDAVLDEESLRELVADIVRQELQGALGERITRNVRKLVRREIHRALTAQELD